MYDVVVVVVVVVLRKGKKKRREKRERKRKTPDKVKKHSWNTKKMSGSRCTYSIGRERDGIPVIIVRPSYVRWEKTNVCLIIRDSFLPSFLPSVLDFHRRKEKTCSSPDRPFHSFSLSLFRYSCLDRFDSHRYSRQTRHPKRQDTYE